jgi:hypothetical protein
MIYRIVYAMKENTMSPGFLTWVTGWKEVTLFQRKI